MDYAGLLVYGRQFHTFLENLFAFFSQVIFSASLGVLFIYILNRVTTKYLMLKGIFFAINIWYLIFGLVLLYKVPYVLVLTFEGGIENFITALLFGFFLAETYRILYLRN